MDLFLLGLLTVLAFVPNWVDAGTAPRWAVLAVGIPLCALWRGIELPHSWRLLLFVLAPLIVTILWTPNQITALDEVIHLLILASAFWLGAQIRDIRLAWVGLIVGINLMAMLAIAQFFGWQGIPQAVPPAGLFVNKNILAEAGLVSVVAAVAMRRWWLVPGSLIAATLPLSRSVLGALLIMGSLFVRNQVLRTFTVTLVVGLCTAAFVLNLDTSSGLERVMMWGNAVRGMRWFGNGIGSFSAMYPFWEYAHNEFIQLTFEFGLMSLPLVGLLIYALRGPSEVEHAVLGAVLIMACLSFPLHIPLTGFAAALAAGHLVAARSRVCDINMLRAMDNRRSNDWANNYWGTTAGIKDGATRVPTGTAPAWTPGRVGETHR